jgi:rare lipoprotein A (peptidoglycan hydrolase)
VATTIAFLALAGCGASASDHSTRSADRATSAVQMSTITAAVDASTPDRRARPHAVEPVAGQAGGAAATTADPSPPQAATASDAPTPDQPATVSPGAAKGAPSDSEVRAEIARFKLVVARYHLDRIDFSADLLAPDELPSGLYHTSIASVETLYGHRDACGTILRPDGIGVANKTLPCGTEVIFVYHGRAIRVPVQDRGPYIPGRQWDLSGAAAEALRFPGLGPVQWRLASG